MKKQLTYMVVHTETATLPLCAEITNGDAEKKKKLAIAKPLIYDIGWTITNRKGEILDRKQFLVTETFAVPQVFNTAYYADKRPRYIEMLNRHETELKMWNEIMDVFMQDLRSVDAVGAFNSMFDFKKALPFTELYISKLYSDNYYAWEEIQRQAIMRILSDNRPARNPEFDPGNFKFRGEEFPLFDLWGLATTHLLNNVSYKNECLNHGLLTASGTFFKTSAESTYQYLCNKYDFIESHTALDDAMIETFILSKIAKRHAISLGIEYFPFRNLGSTDEFVMRKKKPNVSECQIVYDAIATYVDSKYEANEFSNYVTGLVNRLHSLANYAGMVCAY